METTEKVDGQCKGGHGDKKISFPMTYDQHTKQHRVETSGSSLIVILKMMEDRKEGRDKSKTCCLYGPWPSISLRKAYRSDSEVGTICICERVLLFVTVS